MTRDETIADVLPPRGRLAGSDVLVAAPTGDSLRGIPERVLTAGAGPGDGAVVVSTRHRGSVVDERLADRTPLSADRIGVVDCTPGGNGRRRNGDDLKWAVNSPGDLTGSGIAVEECVSALGNRGIDRVHVLFDTLSTLLVSVEVGAVLQYVHHLTTGAEPPAGIGVYPVHTNVLDERDLARLEHLFDASVEVRRRDGARQVRRRGFDAPLSEWVPLEPDRQEPRAPVSD